MSAGQYISGTGTELVFGSTRLHGKNTAKVLFLCAFAIFFALIYRRLETVTDNFTIKKCSETIHTENSETFSEVISFVIQYVCHRKQILSYAVLCSWVFLWWGSWHVGMAHESQIHSPAGEEMARLESWCSASGTDLIDSGEWRGNKVGFPFIY